MKPLIPKSDLLSSARVYIMYHPMELLSYLLFFFRLKARSNELAIEDMDGGTFTISNGGVFGSMMGTPIINPPQSSILGMHAIIDRPVAVNGKVSETGNELSCVFMNVLHDGSWHSALNDCLCSSIPPLANNSANSIFFVVFCLCFFFNICFFVRHFKMSSIY